ncbi:MAG: CHAT domain-containing protein [Cyclobacteriaceae bacterium]
MRPILFLNFILISWISLGQVGPESDADKLFDEGKFDRALEYYQEAAKLAQAKSPGLYAKYNLQIARCFLGNAEIERAIAQANRTLSYISDVIPSETDLTVDGLLVVGEANLKLGRNDLALDALNKAEATLQDTESLIAAACYNDLGVIYWNNQNKETSSAYHQQALDIRKASLDKNDVLLADSYLNLGLIYLGDNFLKAIINFNNALKIYQNAYGRNHPQVALCYSNLAFANSSESNFTEALTYLESTLAIWESNFEGDHPNKAFTKSNMGRILSEQGNYDQALVLHEDALQQYIRLYGDKHPEVANTYYLIGTVQNEKSNYKEAILSFQRSIYSNLIEQNYSSQYELPELDGYFNGDILLSSLQAKAQALEAIHFEKSLSPIDIKSALDTYLLCDDLIAQIRQGRLTEGDKIRIGKVAAEIYDSGIRTSIYLANKTFKRKYYEEMAFIFCERSKSAVLLEAISDTKAKSFAGIPESMLILEDSLKTQMSFIEQQLASNKDDAKITSLENQLFELRKSYRSFIGKLETDYPNYFNLKYRKSDISLSELQGKLDDYSAILSYFIGEESIYIFAITNDQMEITEVPKSDKLLQLVKGMLNGIKYHVTDVYKESSKKLYDQLIPTIPKMVQYLAIIPDGLLGTIPFEALAKEDEDGEIKYLLEEYAISYDYAASLLNEKLNKQPGTGKGILLSAPVTFDNNDLKMVPLPGSQQEVKEIRYLFLGDEDRPDVILKADASESNLKSEMISKYKYLHFATHGIVHESKPELSRIFLSPDEQNDGSLYSGEIYNLDINADLVALSACETGLGKIEKGEGIIGLSRSLMYAGAKNMMVSLWQVSDASTSQLMIEFYRQHLHHSSNMSFADDLRKAKLMLLKDETYSDPYYWAPFILIGL